MLNLSHTGFSTQSQMTYPGDVHNKFMALFIEIFLISIPVV